MKKFIIFLFTLATTLFAIEQSDIYMFRESVSDYYYRFLDTTTSFLYEKSNYSYIKKHNKLKLYIDNSIDENGKLNSSVSIRANIKLPKISKNLYLTLDKESTNVENNKISQLQEEKQNSRIGLKYYFYKSKEQNIFAKLGGRLQGSKIYMKFGIDQLDHFDYINTYKYFNEYFYIKDGVFKSEVGLDFKKNLSKKFNIAQLNNLTFDDDSIFYLSNTLLLNQYVNNKSILSYWTTLYSTYDKKYEKDSISFNIKYHYMLKKWIFVDLIPSLVRNFKDNEDNKAYLYLNFGFIF